MGTVRCGTSATTTVGGGGAVAPTLDASLPLHPALISSAAVASVATREAVRFGLSSMFMVNSYCEGYVICSWQQLAVTNDKDGGWRGVLSLLTGLRGKS